MELGLSEGGSENVGFHGVRDCAHEMSTSHKASSV